VFGEDLVLVLGCEGLCLVVCDFLALGCVAECIIGLLLLLLLMLLLLLLGWSWW